MTATAHAPHHAAAAATQEDLPTIIMIAEDLVVTAHAARIAIAVAPLLLAITTNPAIVATAVLHLAVPHHVVAETILVHLVAMMIRMARRHRGQRHTRIITRMGMVVEEPMADQLGLVPHRCSTEPDANLSQTK